VSEEHHPASSLASPEDLSRGWDLDGLAGEAIPLPARILAVADSLAAMTADRPHRGAHQRRTAATDRPRQQTAVAVEGLVVDSCAQVRQVLAEMLSRQGYLVHQAAEDDQAVAVLRGRPGQVRFALIDVWMPWRDGRTTAAALRQVEPGLPFAFMTPDPSQINVAELLSAGAATVLVKPFDLAQLTGVIAALTQGPDSPGQKEA
jgi:response regulator RpfG family c-di-GMP phosphodiesterase